MGLQVTDSVLDLIEKLLSEPTAKSRVAEIKKATAEHDKKLAMMKDEDVKLEAKYQAAVKESQAATAIELGFKKRDDDLREREGNAAAREVALAKAEKEHAEFHSKKGAELKAREIDLVRREQAIKPTEAKLSSLDKQLKDQEASLKAREAKAKDFARSLIG